MRAGGETKEEEEVEKEQLQDQLLPSDASQRFVFFNTESIMKKTKKNEKKKRKKKKKEKKSLFRWSNKESVPSSL